MFIRHSKANEKKKKNETPTWLVLHLYLNWVLINLQNFPTDTVQVDYAHYKYFINLINQFFDKNFDAVSDYHFMYYIQQKGAV